METVVPMGSQAVEKRGLPVYELIGYPLPFVEGIDVEFEYPNDPLTFATRKYQPHCVAFEEQNTGGNCVMKAYRYWRLWLCAG